METRVFIHYITYRYGPVVYRERVVVEDPPAAQRELEKSLTLREEKFTLYQYLKPQAIEFHPEYKVPESVFPEEIRSFFFPV